MNKIGKKKLIVLIGILVGVIICGIGFKNIVDYNIACNEIRDGKYDEAKSDLANIVGERAHDMSKNLEYYEQAKISLEDNKLSQASNLLTLIIGYKDLGKFTNDVDGLKSEINKREKDAESVNDTLMDAKDLVEKHNIKDAESKLNSLKDCYINNDQKRLIKELKSEIDGIKAENKKKSEEQEAKKKAEAQKKKESSNGGFTAPMSIADCERYLNQKLGASHKATYHYKNSDETCEGKIYIFKENQNVGVNGPDVYINPATGDVWTDEDNLIQGTL